MNLDRLFLIISCIFMIIMYTKMITLEKKSLENFGNDNIIEHLENTDEDRVREIVKEEYNHDVEAIRNLGAISKSLLTGKNFHKLDGTATTGDLTIPANLKVSGWAVAVPVGAIIMWSRSDIPPSPNTVPYNGENTYSDQSNTWFPCIGGSVNGVTIPNFRGRMPVGHGSTDGNLGANHAHNFPIILQQTEGIMPVANHNHAITVHSANAKHSHQSAATLDGGYNGTRLVGSDRSKWQKNYTHQSNDANAPHAHTASASQPTGTVNNNKTRGTHFSRHNIPHATVIQFWIRIR